MLIRVIRGRKKEATKPYESTPQTLASTPLTQPLTTHNSLLTTKKTGTPLQHPCLSFHVALVLEPKPRAGADGKGSKLG